MNFNPAEYLLIVVVGIGSAGAGYILRGVDVRIAELRRRLDSDAQECSDQAREDIDPKTIIGVGRAVVVPVVADGLVVAGSDVPPRGVDTGPVPAPPMTAASSSSRTPVSDDDKEGGGRPSGPPPAASLFGGWFATLTGRRPAYPARHRTGVVREVQP